MATILNKGSSKEPNRIRPQYASSQVRRQALRLFRAGFGYKSVSTLLHLSPHTVRDWNRAFKSGKFSVELSGNQYRYDDKTRELVLKLRAEGRSWKDISDITGVSISTCRSWVKALRNRDDECAEEKESLPSADARALLREC